MNGALTATEAARLATVALAFLAAAVADLKRREIDDRLWQASGAAGFLLGFVAVAPDGALPAVLWLVAGAFALEHLFPWDDALGERGEKWVVPVEIATYLLVLIVFASAAIRLGVGGAGVPWDALALVITVIAARGLFEVGILYGGADAKAVIVAGLVVPVLATPLLGIADFQAPVLAVLPFAVTVLTNAAVLSLAVPLGLALRNALRGEFSFPRGFTGYSLPVALLPRRFVWVRDEAVGEDGLAHDVDTSEEDLARRRELARRLQARGVRRVWVSPQIPFVVLIGMGVLSGVVVGNLLLQLFALL